MRIFAPLFCLALLTGCTSDLTKLKDLNPPADNFNGALAAEYRDFADSEAEQGRSSVARHFAEKGLDSYHGKEVGPDLLDLSLSTEQQAELSEARGQLLRLSTAEVKDAAPQELAHTLLLFDCWQQQVVSQIEPEKALCKAAFGTSLTQLLEKVGPEIYNRAFRHSISFAPKQTTLDEAGRADIEDVVCELNGMHDYWVELHAYMGKKASQHKLVEARLSAVKKALVKAGIPTRKIRTHREGGKSVMLSRDNIAQNTKIVTITISAETQGAKEAK